MSDSYTASDEQDFWMVECEHAYCGRVFTSRSLHWLWVVGMTHFLYAHFFPGRLTR